MSEITMPKLSDSMEEGKILRWLKAPGQSVSVGEVLVEVETDKADMEIEAEQAGTLTEIRLQEGEVGPVGVVIAVLDGEQVDGRGPAATAQGGAEAPPAAAVRGGAEAPPAADPQATAPEPPTAAAVREEVEAPPVADAQTTPAEPPAAGSGLAPGRASGVVRVSPLARTRAAELGIDPSTLQGTGPGGRVTRQDVENARRTETGLPPPTQAPQSEVVVVRPPPPPPAPSVGPPPGDSMEVQRIPVSGMRAAIARRMTESKRDAPHFYVSTIANMDEAVGMRASLKARGGAASSVTYNHLVLKACAEALREVPEMNSRFAGDAVEILSEVNLGVATAVSEGLIVPVISRADELSLLALATRARELAEKARQRSFAREDLSGATFTVSNLGMYDIESFTAVLNPPQAGILAVGSVAQRPVVVEGALGVAHTVNLTLSCDHRAVDGAIAAQFLGQIRERLEHPVGLLLPRDTE